MSLVEYKRKRNFRKTPEPAGKQQASRGALSFVVQKHDASRLHYDFRLELEGTLKSWAVPKGPSLDPAVKSLAVQVEDHPLDYADFEGIIPAGQYGGGTVMVWDHGTWEPEGNVDPSDQWRGGRLKFTLHGKKLKGSWALIRMGGMASDGGKNWLLIKHDDRSAKPTEEFDVREQKNRSVVSRRTMEQIAAASDRVWNSKTSVEAKAAAKQSFKAKKTPAKAKPAKGAKRIAVAELAGATKRTLPRTFEPQLATLVAEAPQGDQWVHELKFDGYRILARIAKGKVALITRRGNDWTHRFPTVAAAVAELPIQDGIVDDPEIATRISQYEMAFRMQTSVPALRDFGPLQPSLLIY